MSVHVFFDNSNIWGGAQNQRLLVEPHVPWTALRLYYRNLFQLIHNGRPIASAILGGSVPPSCESLWQYARDHGYETNLLRKVAKDDGSIGEQGVDEVLHLKMANTVMRYRNEPNKQMILATGDGKVSEFGTGFPLQIRLAIEMSWDVQVWSWSNCLSGEYTKLEKEFPNKLKVSILDNFYKGITFVKEGNYYLQRPDGVVDVYVPGRIVSNL